jgi:asparaginyl-tRNA synthetase
MIEPEMAFYELTDNMDLAEAFIKRIIKDVLEHCAEDMKFFKALARHQDRDFAGRAAAMCHAGLHLRCNFSG